MRALVLAALVASTGCYVDSYPPYLEAVCNGRLTVGVPVVAEVRIPEDDIAVPIEPLAARMLDLDHEPSDLVIPTLAGHVLTLDPRRVGAGFLELTVDDDDPATPNVLHYFLDVRATPAPSAECGTSATPRYLPL